MLLISPRHITILMIAIDPTCRHCKEPRSDIPLDNSNTRYL